MREHTDAVAAFVDAVDGVPADEWAEPIGSGKWTPAQITEHVILAYRVLLDELGGAPPMKAKAGPIMQRVLRWFLLPHIIFHRTFPRGARSPREVRPSDEGILREGAVARLVELAREFERRLPISSVPYLTHPYFGRVDLVRALRFAAVHTDHHRRQLETVAGRSPSAGRSSAGRSGSGGG